MLQQQAPKIVFNERDLSSASNFGKKALKELDVICEHQFKKSAQTVIAETPKSKLIKKPSSIERLSEKRKIVRDTKKAIQQAMDDCSTNTVMGNRISWRKFDAIRKSQTLDSLSTPSRKRKRVLSDENSPPPKRKQHGSLSLPVTIKEDLLAEAQTWTDDETVNWSSLARRHGVVNRNGGQTVKEFLRAHSIPAASKVQRKGRSLRRKRKVLPGGIPFPMQHHSSSQKKKLQSCGINVGVSVVPTSISSFSFDKTDNKVVEITSSVHAKKIPLLDIRKKLLLKHENLGIIRDTTTEAGSASNPAATEKCRYLKVWHDHSSIAGHGYFLVLVSVLYDSSFFLTQQEAALKLGKKIDVQSTVETPEIHILGRSSSSLEDQALFSACRNECLSELSTSLCLSNGVQVTDIIRFFHGDGPAQQFEAGNSIGGNYCCVGCGVKSDRIDDIAYAFRCPKLDLLQRQDFLLEGEAWRNICSRPLDKLLLSDLRKELSMRGLSATGKKPALEKAFDDIRQGISNFPALLQDQPEATLHSLNLQHYKVSPTEPLHDLKGHLGNIIDEALLVASGNALQELKRIKAAVLTKEAIRCSDLRKAVILMYLKLKELEPNSMLTDLFRTSVEIAKLCYAHDAERTPRAVLCLHNRTFLHAYQCSTLFASPKSTTRRRMFGRFFHSITTHAASLFRIVSLRSLNTEQHERMFQQAKGITKATSNNHTEHVISNVIQRLHFEQGVENEIASQETQIKSLAQALGPMENTVFPHSMLEKVSEHYQAHLERISDFLLRGPGVWWKETPRGIIFFDGSDEKEYQDDGPTLQHFRSVSSADVNLHLQKKWEACCSTFLQDTCAFMGNMVN